MTEIGLDNDQKNAERGSTPATDIHLEAEQRAMQALHALQLAFHAAADTDTTGMAPPSASPDIPLAERAERSALHGTSFGDILEEIDHDYIADLHRISEAFAAPLANLFAFAKHGAPSYPKNSWSSMRFWQNGLFAFVSGCCSHNNQHRRQIARAQQKQH